MTTSGDIHAFWKGCPCCGDAGVQVRHAGLAECGHCGSLSRVDASGITNRFDAVFSRTTGEPLPPVPLPAAEPTGFQPLETNAVLFPFSTPLIPWGLGGGYVAAANGRSLSLLNLASRNKGCVLSIALEPGFGDINTQPLPLPGRRMFLVGGGNGLALADPRKNAGQTLPAAALMPRRIGKPAWLEWDERAGAVTVREDGTGAAACFTPFQIRPNAIPAAEETHMLLTLSEGDICSATGKGWIGVQVGASRCAILLGSNEMFLARPPKGDANVPELVRVPYSAKLRPVWKSRGNGVAQLASAHHASPDGGKFFFTDDERRLWFVPIAAEAGVGPNPGNPIPLVIGNDGDEAAVRNGEFFTICFDSDMNVNRVYQGQFAAPAYSDVNKGQYLPNHQREQNSRHHPLFCRLVNDSILAVGYSSEIIRFYNIAQKRWDESLSIGGAVGDGERVGIQSLFISHCWMAMPAIYQNEQGKQLGALAYWLGNPR